MTDTPQNKPEQPDLDTAFVADDLASENAANDTTTSHKNEQIMTISVSILNYALVAIVFLFVGMVVGSRVLTPQQNSSSTLDAAALTQIEQIVRGVVADLDLSAGGDAANLARFDLVDDDPYIGDENAPVVIVEFSDFRCTFCGRHFAQTLDPLLANYGEHIRYVYRDFAALGPESTNAALAAECAHDQDAFWEFHNAFFSNQSQLSRNFYISTAEANNLNVDQFTECLDSRMHLGEIDGDQFDGQLEGVAGTPGFFINGTFIRGAMPYEIFERVVVRELERAGIDPSRTS